MSDGGDDEALLQLGRGDGEGRQIPSPPHPMCLLRLFDAFQHDRTVGDVLREVGGTEGFAEEIDHRRLMW